jgi:DNA-binding MarR family transcriptional regulator
MRRKDRLVDAVLYGLRGLSAESDHVDQVAAELYGINRTDLHGLDLLGLAGRLSPTALARGLGMTTGGATTVIDRLERAGYLRRCPDPDDRRRLVLEPTEKTARRDAEVYGDLVRRSRELAAAYSAEELELIAGFLAGARSVYSAHAAQLEDDRPGSQGAAEGTPDR